MPPVDLSARKLARFSRVHSHGTNARADVMTKQRNCCQYLRDAVVLRA
jgi:hypothetical protein